MERGAAEPTINTSGDGTPCGTTEQTITLDSNSLSAGAKDIYIVVKDAAGNVSSSTFRIEIPAYTAPVPEPTPPPEPPAHTSTPTDDDLDDNPDTGDDSSVGFLIGILMIAAAGLTVCAVLWRKYRRVR